ncbi:hypothetical protein A2379_02770 [Candidatus Amesbacteria bacterium RIFOXYB1_FULL_47_13]|nr:MAG: hypothetical protein A2379_02770 [Candidatus Amesbacteria bacterium RIFOXYB1_FULL_47_13]HBC72245.1 hypothetical protein [Candidatus Amesbacteria bacterium]
MGKVGVLTGRQKLILELVGGENELYSRFYFTGGTALSEYYLKHRESVDLDFFSETQFDTQMVATFLDEWARVNNFKFSSEQVGPVFINQLDFGRGKKLKVDFVYFPHKQLEEGKIILGRGLKVDSLLDIAANKLLAAIQRSEVKDYVDLYFLLQEFSVWDLREAVRVKFGRETDPLVIASHLMLVEDFEYLPLMVKPLTLPELIEFYRQEAKKLGRTAVE